MAACSCWSSVTRRSRWVIEAIRTYDDADRIEDIMRLPGMTNTGRGLLYETLRMCSSDGALTSEELDRVLRAADGMDLSRDLVADLQQVVLRRRHCGSGIWADHRPRAAGALGPACGPGGRSRAEAMVSDGGRSGGQLFPAPATPERVDRLEHP